MIRIIKQVLSPDEVTRVVAELGAAAYYDGKRTANGMARAVKNNQQLDEQRHAELLGGIRQKILEHNEFRLYARPKALTPLMISRYAVGQEYGRHSDNAVIGGLRTDVSFTLFLGDPKSYDGGELEIDLGATKMRFKLASGNMVIYPTQYVHRVTPVTRGERLAAVGWAQSVVADVLKRETLADLDVARALYLQRHGHDQLADIMFKTSTNLERMWADM